MRVKVLALSHILCASPGEHIKLSFRLAAKQGLLNLVVIFSKRATRSRGDVSQDSGLLL